MDDVGSPRVDCHRTGNEPVRPHRAAAHLFRVRFDVLPHTPIYIYTLLYTYKYAPLPTDDGFLIPSGASGVNEPNRLGGEM